MRRSNFSSTADLVLSGTDRSNFVRLQLAAPGGVLTFNKILAGASTTTGITRTNNVTNPLSPAIGETIELRVFPSLGIVEYYRNELLESTWSGIDSSTAAVWGGLYGFSTNNTARGWDDIVFRSLSNRLVVTSFEEPAFSSQYINNAENVSDFIGAAYTASFSYSTSGTAPTAMQYRVRKRDTPYTVLTDWTDCTSFSAASGSGTAGCRLPVDDRFVLELRLRNDISTTAGTGNEATCGMAIASYGQSNGAFFAQQGLTNRAFEPSATRTLADASILGNTDLRWSTTSYTTMRTAAGILQAALGIPVLATGGGIGSQYITALDPANTSGLTFTDAINGGTDSGWNLLKKKFSQGGKADLGNIASLVWVQGEAEGANTSASNFTQYATLLGNIRSGYRSQLGNGQTPWFFVMGTGRGNSTATGSNNDNYTNVRKTQFNFQNLPNKTAFAASLCGVQLVDEDHYDTTTQWGSEEAGKRIALSILYYQFGIGTFDGRGPRLESASRSGAVITLPITANGATGYGAFNAEAPATSANASALTGYRVSTASNFSSLLTISSAVLSGSNVVITLSADPGVPVYIDSFYGRNPDTTSWVYGTYTGFSRISLEPIYNPLVTST